MARPKNKNIETPTTPPEVEPEVTPEAPVEPEKVDVQVGNTLPRTYQRGRITRTDY